MFHKSASSQHDDQSTAPAMHRRQHARRHEDRCVSIINGQMYPVENWSGGGMLIYADERLFAKDQKCVFTLKFKLRDEIVEVDHEAMVIRKAPHMVALKFASVTKKVQNSFQRVVDDFVAQRFVESQTLA